MFIKVKMRLDLAMVIIALAYLVSFGLRAFLDGKLTYLSAGSTLLIQGIMYYFVFEMMRLKDKLSSESLEESLMKSKRTRNLKFAVYGTFLIFVIAPLMFIFGVDAKDDLYLTEIIDITLFVRGFFRLGVDLTMLFQFYFTFSYFVNKKRNIILET